MHRLFLTLLAIQFSSAVSAQTDSMDLNFTFRITDYSIKLNDTTTTVQVNIPAAWPVKIKDRQIGVLKPRYETGKTYDTTIIGWGRCHLIKSEWHYFTLYPYRKERWPQQGDLLVTKCKMPKTYSGLLFNLLRNGIAVTKVDDDLFYHSAAVFSLNPQTEKMLIDSMAADIRFTGQAMLAQNDSQDQTISGGIYDGKKLFVSMKTIAGDDVKKFLKYMNARPDKYAGNSWKIAEVFATWMTSQTPEVIEN